LYYRIAAVGFVNIIIIKTVSIIICIGPTGLRLWHIGKTDPQCGTVHSAFTRAASLAQLVLALGPSPRPWDRTSFIYMSAL